MKLTFRISENATVELEGDSQAEIHKQLSSATEAFGHKRCGACKSEDIIARTRVVDAVAYLEWNCRACSATLSMGQQKGTGQLYPRRRLHKEAPEVKAGKAKTGDFISNGGWQVWKAV